MKRRMKYKIENGCMMYGKIEKKRERKREDRQIKNEKTANDKAEIRYTERGRELEIKKNERDKRGTEERER